MHTNLPSLPPEIANSVAHARLPEAYETAKAALAECARIDELDDWADRTVTLASYARQVNDPELFNFAPRIRARAVRKLGELLREYNARWHAESRSPPTSTFPSRAEAAAAAGISRHTALVAARVARVPQDQFDARVESQKPPGTTQLAALGRTTVVRRYASNNAVAMRSPRYRNCSVGEVTRSEDGFAFSILNQTRQVLSFAFESRADAEQARAAVAETVAKAVTIRGSL
jgi:hypothetical protein